MPCQTVYFKGRYGEASGVSYRGKWSGGLTTQHSASGLPLAGAQGGVARCVLLLEPL